MRTMTHILWMAILLISAFVSRTSLGQSALWNWDDGDVQGWYADPLRGNPTISLGVGHESDYSLSVSGPVFSTVRVANPGLESDDLLGSGHYGDFLPFASGAGILLDTDFQIPTQHGVYLDLVIYGFATESRWICYPFDGIGNVVSFGDGWYRCSFENVFAHEYSEDIPAPSPELENSVLLTWSEWAPNGDRIDNFRIIGVPEPSSSALVALGSLSWLLFGPRCREQRARA